jgi:hypothetical protein
MTIHDGDVAFRPAPGIESAVVAGELCLLEPRRSQLVILNDAAAAVWQLAGSGAAFDSIVRQLEERFDIEPALVRAEISATVEQLEQSGLLVRRA